MGTLALLALALAPMARAAIPADPAAMPDARRILTYLENLPARTDNRVVSGQFIGYAGAHQSGYQAEISSLQQKTGKWVGMVSTDFAFSTTSTQQVGASLETYWKAGHWISLSYHLPDPRVQMGSMPGNAAWMSTLDFIAERLKYLQDRGVIVFWRPFHEMNGDWFWWGNKDPAAFKAAWKHMFDYFTKTKGLHNLLWVYAPDDSRGKVTDFYPGPEFVDVVGLDNYNWNAPTLDLTSYAAMTALGKPFGLTEFSPKSSQATSERADYKVLVNGGLKDRFPKITFFLCWDREWGLNYNLNPEAVLNDPWVITRDELDWKNTEVGLAPIRPSARSHDGAGIRLFPAYRKTGAPDWRDPRGRLLPILKSSDLFGSR
jgi:mannan endo-1,4-beta-mannosidase